MSSKIKKKIQLILKDYFRENLTQDEIDILKNKLKLNKIGNDLLYQYGFTLIANQLK